SAGSGPAAAGKGSFVSGPGGAGGLGIMYTLVDPGGNKVTNLKLTRRAVCRMFTEPRMLWNDPEIQGANPGLGLPAEPITPVVRSDRSGTSYIMAQYCIIVAPDVWAKFRAYPAQQQISTDDPEFNAGRPTDQWPLLRNMAGGYAADGVAGVTASTTYAATYNEAGFATVNGFPNASLENGVAGTFVQPEEARVN